MHCMKLGDNEDDMADTEVCKHGHPQPCTAGTCLSKLRVLRAVSVHYLLLRRALENDALPQWC